jgi:hypothetical protein
VDVRVEGGEYHNCQLEELWVSGDHWCGEGLRQGGTNPELLDPVELSGEKENILVNIYKKHVI